VPSGSAQGRNVEHCFLVGNTQNLIHLIVKEAGNAADTQSQMHSSEIQALTQMSGIKM
jgi:hypothetical protein